jgi:uncharacterized protein with FMN-binding domain
VVTGVRRIVLWGISTLTVLVLLFGYRTSTSSRMPSDGAAPAAAPVGGGASSSPGSGPAGGGSAGTTAGKTAGRTVAGDPADTRWGPVQVEITVAGGKVTAVQVVDYPQNNGRDREINAYALPVLVQETLGAQSAQVDMVSGATVTSEGYLQSLQSALDQAGL